MPTQTELAWQLLQITALALPALAILLQALLQMTGDEGADIVHNYRISLFALFLVAPLALAGVITSFKLLTSYREPWLQWALGLMGASFFLLPIFLFMIWRGNRRIFLDIFLENEKELIQGLRDDGKLTEEEAEADMRRVQSHQKGIKWHLRNFEDSLLFQRLSKIFAVIALGSAVLLLYASNDLVERGFAVAVILYSIFSLKNS